MTSGEKIFEINAIGTIYIDEAFGEVMGPGSVILNVASMSAYMLPQDKTPENLYRLALTDVDALRAAVGGALAAVLEQQQTGMAYTLSKSFVIWYTSRMAVRYGKQGIRVVSISPGTFNTPMGEVEGEEATSFARRGALGRLGEPEEIAKMMAFMVSDACSYLSGVDILYDGGSIAALRAMQDQA